MSNFELVNDKKSCEPYRVSLNIEPIRNSSGAVYADLSIQCDVPERRQLELRTVELSHLEVAQPLARPGRIETELAGGMSRRSCEVYRILGLAPDDTPRGFGNLLAHAHPDDPPA